jgi:hypothetical protein
VDDVQVVEQGTPDRILIQSYMSETDESPGVLGDERAAAVVGAAESLGPDGQAVCGDITIQVAIGIRAAVVTPPTVGMQLGDICCVRDIGQPVALRRYTSHVGSCRCGLQSWAPKR